MTATIEFLGRLRRLGVGVELDAGRLRVRAPSGVLTDDLRAELRSRREEITALLGAAAADPGSEPIPRARRDGPLPLSSGQQRLWLLDRMDPGSSEYNVPIVMRLTGPVDLAALSGALEKIIARHEALRTTIAEHDGQPRQLIHPPRACPLPVTDLSDLPPGQALAEATRIVAADCDRPFDLATGPLLRAAVVRLAPGDHVLALTLHHIICDEWSARLLHAELAAGYRAGGTAALPPLPVHYADYAVWQRERMSGRLFDDQLGYWRRQLADLPVLRLPTDRPRPPVRDHRGGVVDFTIPAATTSALAALGRAHQATLFMVLATAFTVLLARYTGQDDIVIGTPVAGRAHPATEELIGFFANTLVLRADLAGNPTFTEALGRVRETALDAYAHAELPFERLVERLSPERDRSRHPLFQVMFNVEDAPSDDGSPIPGTCLGPFGGDLPARARFDLRMILAVADGPTQGSIEYRTDLFDPGTVRQLAAHFGVLLAAIADGPGRRIGHLPLLDASEHSRLTAPASPSGPARPLPETIAACAGHLTAVSGSAGTLTYAQLDAAAAGVDAQLRGLGIGPGMVVAVALPHDTVLIAALLGVWRAGAAFLALDPRDPLDRQNYQLQAASAALVLTTGETGDLLPATPVPVGSLQPAAGPPPPPRRAALDGLAYVVFTSGTTGRPRPVGCTHRGLAHYAAGITDRIRPGPRQTWLLGQPLSVDLGLTNVVAALSTGGHLRITDPGDILGALLAGPPDHVKITPTHLRLLLTRPGGAAGLPRRTLILGGEPTPTALLDELAGTGWAGTVHNHYGPAETTVGVTTARDDGTRPLPLGHPLPGTACLVLDVHGQPVPAGVAGQIHVSGPTLARGYLGDPAATAERFVASPFSASGERIYRTGDLARRAADGSLRFLGRSDDQLNVHGHRVEPAEVESVLCGHPQVQAAAVALRTGPAGEDLLTAWLVPVVPDEIRDWLAARLPLHLVPSAWTAVAALPLAPNGKTDRRRLPAPAPAAPANPAGDPPDGPTEKLLAGLWRDLIPAAHVGRDDNFFDLGGHSLLAAQLIARLGVDLPLTALFDHPTLRELAVHIDDVTAQAGHQ
jgi:amino acid adenylation domain-containing protein